MARASVGPVERLLNMLGEQRACAAVYASAFVAQPRALRRADPAHRRRRRRGRDSDRADRRIHRCCSSSPSAGSASTSSSGAAPKARTSHARCRFVQSISSRVARACRARTHRRGMARARRTRARAQRVLRAGLRAGRGAGVRRRRRRRAGADTPAAGSPACFRRGSSAGAAGSLRCWSAGPIRLRRSARRWSTATSRRP